MKKILLATTLIAASTGYAAAEVTVTGEARMGVVMHNDNTTGLSTDAAFSSRVRIIFTATGETDNGLSFGASVRNDQGGVGNTVNGDSTVYLSGAFGKVTMGDTGNAVDSLLGQVSGVGYTGLGDLNEISFLSKDFTGVMYEYSAGAVTFGLGAGQTADTDSNPASDNFVSAAVKYSTDAYSVGLGYESNDAVDQLTLTGSGSFSGATVKAKIVDSSDLADLQYALSVDYTMNGIGITAFYADALNTNDLADHINGGLQTTRYGIGASYDLGGGASVKGGIAREEGTDTVAELGVTMAF